MAKTLPATPIISVIVATRNRQESLGRFIEALRALPEQPAWEVILADNGSSDGTAELLTTAANDLPAVIIQVKQPGKSRTLNAALKHARGEILLFTDDDVVPDRNWLAAMCDASMQYSSANIFGGRIRVDAEEVPEWIVRSSNLTTMLVSEQDLGDKIRWFGFDQYPLGPNLAVRRQTLANGRFGWPTNLGPGTRIPLGDERAFLMQFSSAGARDRLYVPDSIVRHCPRARELNLGRAVFRCFRGGYAAGLLSRVHEKSDDRLHAGAARAVLRRLRGLSTGKELFCVMARGCGVAAGAISPFGRVVYD